MDYLKHDRILSKYLPAVVVVLFVALLMSSCATLGVDLRSPIDKIDGAAKSVISINNTVADYYTMGAITKEKAVSMRRITKEAEGMIEDARAMVELDPDGAIDLYELVSERLLRLSDEILRKEIGRANE